jgi:hypothetical protein
VDAGQKTLDQGPSHERESAVSSEFAGVEIHGAAPIPASACQPSQRRARAAASS